MAPAIVFAALATLSSASLAPAQERSSKPGPTTTPSTLKLVRTVQRNAPYIASVVFSPDGSYALVLSTDQVHGAGKGNWNVKAGDWQLIRLSDGQTLWSGAIPHVRPTTASVSLDGRRAVIWGTDSGPVAARNPNAIFGELGYGAVFDLPNAKEIARPADDKTMFHALSADGKRILAHRCEGLGSRGVTLCDADTGTAIRTLDCGDGRPDAVAFVPGGEQAIAGGWRMDETVWQWELKTGKAIRRMEGHHNFTWCVACSADGRYAASADNRKILIWDLKTGEEVRRLQVVGGPTDSIAFSPDGRFLLSGAMGEVYFPNIEPDTNVRLWDLQLGVEVADMPAQGEEQHVCFSPDGKMAMAGGGDGCIRFWAMPEEPPLEDPLALKPLPAAPLPGRQLHVFQHPAIANLPSSNSVRAVGWLAIADRGFSISEFTNTEWDMRTGVALSTRSARSHLSFTQLLAISLDATTAVFSSGTDPTAGGEVMQIFDLAKERRVASRNSHGGGTMRCVLSPDCRLAASVERDQVPGPLTTTWVWETNTGRDVRVLERNLMDVTALAFTHDGKRIATATSRDWQQEPPVAPMIKIREIDSGKEVGRFTEAQQVDAIAFLPGDKQVLVAGRKDYLDRSLWLLDAISLRVIWEKRNGDGNSVLAVSPDGSRALTGGNDSDLRVWDVASGKVLRIFDEHMDSIGCACILPDGKRALSGSTDGTMRLWELP